MKNLLLLLLSSLLFVSCANSNPKPKEVFPPSVTTSILIPRQNLSLALAIGQVKTNKILRLHAHWDLITNCDCVYLLNYGTNSGGPYNNFAGFAIDTNSMAFSIDTHTNGIIPRYYFNLSYTNSSGITIISFTEAVYPPYAADHIVLFWNGPKATIIETTNLFKPRNTWTVLTNSDSPVIVNINSNENHYYALKGITNQLFWRGTNFLW